MRASEIIEHATHTAVAIAGTRTYHQQCIAWACSAIHESHPFFLFCWPPVIHFCQCGTGKMSSLITVVTQPPLDLLASATEPVRMQAAPPGSTAFTDSDFSAVLVSTGGYFRAFHQQLAAETHPRPRTSNACVVSRAAAFLRGVAPLESPVLRRFCCWLDVKGIPLPLLPRAISFKKCVVVGVTATTSLAQHTDLPSGMCSGAYLPCFSATPTERCMDLFRRSQGFLAYMTYVPATCTTVTMWTSFAINIFSSVVLHVPVPSRCHFAVDGVRTQAIAESRRVGSWHRWFWPGVHSILVINCRSGFCYTISRGQESSVRSTPRRP